MIGFNSENAAEIIDYVTPDLTYEMQMAFDKHGPVTSDPVRGMANLAEELGEATTEALDATRHLQPEAPAVFKLGCLHRMVGELNQIAAYAIMLRCSMEAEMVKLRRQGGQ